MDFTNVDLHLHSTASDGTDSPVEIVEKNGVVKETTVSGILDSLDSGLKKAFGDTISVCPDCGKVICICSLKKLFGGDKNNVGF